MKSQFDSRTSYHLPSYKAYPQSRGIGSCMGICNDHILRVSRFKWYLQDGVKYCKKCDIPFHIKEILCPCCHKKMRTKPRSTRSRRNIEVVRY